MAQSSSVPSSEAVSDPTRLFRDAMAGSIAGVTIVTADDGEEVHGATVSSFTSVSLDPMQVLICLGEDSRLLAVLRRADAFAVHVLTSEQTDVAKLFAFGEVADRTAVLQRRPGQPPVLGGSLARFGCRLAADYPGGDHRILLGAVEAVTFDPDHDPLIWWRRGLGEARLVRPAR